MDKQEGNEDIYERILDLSMEVEQLKAFQKLFIQWVEEQTKINNSNMAMFKRIQSSSR